MNYCVLRNYAIHELRRNKVKFFLDSAKVDEIRYAREADENILRLTKRLVPATRQNSFAKTDQNTEL